LRLGHDPVAAVYGILGGGGPITDGYITQIRGEADAV